MAKAVRVRVDRKAELGAVRSRRSQVEGVSFPDVKFSDLTSEEKDMLFKRLLLERGLIAPDD